jgi:hypothetical protein
VRIKNDFKIFSLHFVHYSRLTSIFMGLSSIWHGGEAVVVDNDTVASVFSIHPVHSCLLEEEEIEAPGRVII